MSGFASVDMAGLHYRPGIDSLGALGCPPSFPSTRASYLGTTKRARTLRVHIGCTGC